MQERSAAAGIIAILLLALALRLGFGLSRPASDAELAALPDQVEYLTLARHLLHVGGLWFVDPRLGDCVYAFRMPGYPLFAAACGANVRLIRAAQAFVDTSTVLAVYLLARRLLRDRARHAPLLAATLVAFNPLLIYFSAAILSETLFIALLAWGMVLLAGAASAPRGAKATALWIGGGLLIALDVLVRPSAGALPMLLGVAAFFTNWPHARAYQPARFLATAGIAAMMLFLVALVLAPWAWRNHRVLGTWILTDTNAGFTLYDGYNPNATGASDQSFVLQMPELRQMNEINRSAYLGRLAREQIARDPTRAARLALAKAARTWSPVPLSDQFGRPAYRLMLLAYAIPFDLLVLAGLWRYELSRGAKLFLGLPAIYLTLVHALTIGSLRYRLPAEPALAVIAASAVATGVSNKSVSPG